ncbi:MAG: 5-formyltetrahydrofolate cyclo-ligase [Epsilonproteobacteria bacterium]|nr:5-formyltetrahydrofolate cyclo-ligase [Campylobacterota bacterium]
MRLTKEIFRKKSLQTIKNAKKFNKFYKDALLQRRLMLQLKQLRGKNILFYYPLPFEANVINVMQKMRKNNNIFLPFMEGESFKMVPFRLPLKKKSFGIFEADNSLRDIKKIDIAIVPSIGVDGDLKRVGFGKGMYDRFFAKLKKKPYVIFVQPELCYTKQKLCDADDVQADILMTPRKEIKRRYGYR